MIVLALPQRTCVKDLSLYGDMLRLRARAFGTGDDETAFGRGEVEVDRFDALGPTYFLAVDDDRRVVGTARALPATGPTMLGETAPHLLKDPGLANNPHVYEVSRLCIDAGGAPEFGAHGLHTATSAVLAGVIEWGLQQRVDTVLATADAAVERVLARAGLPLQRLSEVTDDHGRPCVAGRLAIDADVLRHVREKNDLAGPVLLPNATTH